jgi:hypothetical protein
MSGSVEQVTSVHPLRRAAARQMQEISSIRAPDFESEKKDLIYEKCQKD